MVNAGKMKYDFSDLRFTDSNAYYRESSNKIWVKVNSLPANQETTIYMYYGYTGQDQLTDPSDPSKVCPGGVQDGYCTELYSDNFKKETTTATLTLQPGPEGIDSLVGNCCDPSACRGWNHGNEGSIQVGYYSGCYKDFRGLIKFDLSSLPSGVTINKAYLQLYAYNYSEWSQDAWPGPHSKTITAYKITQDWGETTVTWNNKPSGDTGVGATAVTSNVNTWTSWDVSDLVSKWYNGQIPNYGVYIDELNENKGYYFYASSDHPNANIRPKLVIEYSSLRLSEFDLGPNFEIASDSTEDSLHLKPRNRDAGIAFSSKQEIDFTNTITKVRIKSSQNEYRVLGLYLGRVNHYLGSTQNDFSDNYHQIDGQKNGNVRWTTADWSEVVTMIGRDFAKGITGFNDHIVEKAGDYRSNMSGKLQFYVGDDHNQDGIWIDKIMVARAVPEALRVVVFSDNFNPALGGWTGQGEYNLTDQGYVRASASGNNSAQSSLISPVFGSGTFQIKLNIKNYKNANAWYKLSVIDGAGTEKISEVGAYNNFQGKVYTVSGNNLRLKLYVWARGGTDSGRYYGSCGAGCCNACNEGEISRAQSRAGGCPGCPSGQSAAGGCGWDCQYMTSWSCKMADGSYKTCSVGANCCCRRYQDCSWTTSAEAKLWVENIEISRVSSTDHTLTIFMEQYETTGTVTSDPPGINCDSNWSDCSELYSSGTIVTLTATRGSADFVRWAGDCSGSTGCPSGASSLTCTVTMDADKSVKVNFGGGCVGAF